MMLIEREVEQRVGREIRKLTGHNYMRSKGIYLPSAVLSDVNGP